MSDADKLSLLVIVICLLGSMFFSGSETAITSYGERRAQRVAEEGGRTGRTISDWVERPVFVLSGILLGNNIFNTLLGATATAMTIRYFAGGAWGDYAVPVAVIVSTGLLLVFGEILPKAIGRAYSQRLTLPALSVLNVFTKITYPVTWLLTKATELVLDRLTRGQDASGAPVTTGELDYLVKIGQEEGSIPADQADLLKKVFRFDDKHVRDIMVTLDRVTAVDESWPLERVREVARMSGHSRLPVYQGEVANVVAVLHIKQLVGLQGDGPDPEVLSKISRPPLFVSESLLIQDLLHRFKEQRVHLAIVVDDAGDVVGVVTLEDVLEQIVGQIFDETDLIPVQSPSEGMGIYYVDGQTSLSNVEERLGLEFGELDGVDSVGDLLARLAGQIPIAGSVFVWESVRFKVLAADAKRIIRVSVEEVEAPADGNEVA